MAALVLLGVAGWRAGGSTIPAVLLAIALPGAAALLWGIFAAPRARVQSPVPRLLTQILVLGTGVAAGFVVLPVGWAFSFAAVVLVNTVPTYAGPFARRRVS